MTDKDRQTIYGSLALAVVASAGVLFLMSDYSPLAATKETDLPLTLPTPAATIDASEAASPIVFSEGSKSLEVNLEDLLDLNSLNL